LSSLPIVSVVIPAYNARKWIGETLESVLSQSTVGTETIVIDDGSSDGTGDFVERNYSWVQLERTQNKGASAARNRGTELAQGEFIQYLDADDLLAPGAIAQRVAALQQSGSDVAYSDWQELVEMEDGSFKRGKVVARTIESVHPDPQIAAFTDFWCPPAALLYRRGIVERIGCWNERLPIIQDARFLLDAALHGGRFEHVSGVGAYYRVHTGASLSRRSAVAFVRDCLTNAVEVELWWKDDGGVNEPRRAALVKVYGGIARASFADDKATFAISYDALERLEPGYVPDNPRHLAFAAKVLGYGRAEHLALRYRNAKRRIKAVASNA
jgi:glycosyltransferase involved in cell wall biosynthesis